jgi:NAD(P)H-nitrite reductase large subunit
MDDYVCFCFGVRRSVIRTAIREHRLRTVGAVSEQTQACLGCRSCYFDIEALIAEVWANELTPALAPAPPAHNAEGGPADAQ